MLVLTLDSNNFFKHIGSIVKISYEFQVNIFGSIRGIKRIDKNFTTNSSPKSDIILSKMNLELSSLSVHIPVLYSEHIFSVTVEI